MLAGGSECSGNQITPESKLSSKQANDSVNYQITYLSHATHDIINIEETDMIGEQNVMPYNFFFKVWSSLITKIYYFAPHIVRMGSSGVRCPGIFSLLITL